MWVRTAPHKGQARETSYRCVHHLRSFLLPVTLSLMYSSISLKLNLWGYCTFTLTKSNLLNTVSLVKIRWKNSFTNLASRNSDGGFLYKCMKIYHAHCCSHLYFHLLVCTGPQPEALHQPAYVCQGPVWKTDSSPQEWERRWGGRIRLIR